MNDISLVDNEVAEDVVYQHTAFSSLLCVSVCHVISIIVVVIVVISVHSVIFLLSTSFILFCNLFSNLVVRMWITW